MAPLMLLHSGARVVGLGEASRLPPREHVIPLHYRGGRTGPAQLMRRYGACRRPRSSRCPPTGSAG
ncbi:MAG: hypothetical protein LC799_24315, partial [Actinobacteria bacterium]|nr:hypothetical protein [Actinomycetota bacterium]